MQELQVFKLTFLLRSGSLHPQWRRGQHHDVKEVTVVTSEAGGELDMKAQANDHLSHRQKIPSFIFCGLNTVPESMTHLTFLSP